MTATGLSALSAVLQHEIAGHIADVERQAAAREAKLELALSQAIEDFTSFNFDVNTMVHRLAVALRHDLSERNLYILEAWHMKFQYLLGCALERAEGAYPRDDEEEEETDYETDDDTSD